MSIDKYEGLGKLKWSVNKEIEEYNSMVKRHNRMIDILYDDAKNCTINMNDYYNDLEYHTEQIDIIRERIRELKDVMKYIKKIGLILNNTVFNSKIYEVGDKED